jgi:quinone-modifying oxidoreductase, subunit QmoC
MATQDKPLTSSDSPPVPHPTFLEEIVAATPGHTRLEHCIQCGTCGGSCPSGADMDHTPRQIFALVYADQRATVLHSNTPWYCVSCYYCTVRCPQEIHITDVMYTLKRLSVATKQHDTATAEDFSRTFIYWVENFGRAFELGLMGVHMMRHNPFGAFKVADMGMGMVTRGRMAFTPRRIARMAGLKAILAKAKELETAK